MTDTTATKPRATLGSMVAVRKSTLTSGQLDAIHQHLTLKQRRYRGGVKEIKVYKESGEWVWLPRMFARRLLKKTHALVDKRSKGHPLKSPEVLAQLGVDPYPSDQPEFVEALVNSTVSNKFGGFGIAPCGTGKTVMGSATACGLGLSTLVIVGKEFLYKQWKNAFENFTRIDGKKPKVGKIQRKRCNFGPDYPFVIAMAQSLASQDYPDEMYRAFGTIIVDEVHHIAAETWFEAISRFYSRYILGVTATLRRKDNLEAVFDYTVGPVLYEMDREPIEADVYYVPVRWVGDRKSVMRVGKLDKNKVSKKLMNDAPRNQILVKYMKEACREKRKVLLLSARRDHLHILFQRLPSDVRKHAGYYMGGMKQSELDHVAENKRIMLGTYSMASEGLDVKEIDVLILATPTSDVEQPVGRALRVGSAKPIILDLVDDHPALKGQAIQRQRTYRKEGLTIKNKW